MKKRAMFWIGLVGAFVAIKIAVVSALRRAPQYTKLSIGYADDFFRVMGDARAAIKLPPGFLPKTIGGAYRTGELVGRFRRVSISGGFVSDIRRVRILGVLPDNKQSFHNVFGKHTLYSRAHEEELKSTVDDLSKLSGYSPFPSIDGEAAIKAAIDATADDQLLIVVGHSTDSGERLALTDGSEIAMDEIQYLATQSRKRCLIVTCHSKDLGLDTTISLTEAAKMCETAVSRVKSAEGSLVDVGDVVLEMRLVLEQSRNGRVTLTVTGLATGGASAGIYVTKFSNNQKPPPFAGVPAKVVREQAEMGNPEAQFWLYRNSSPPRTPDAIAWLEKAAANNHPQANLGLALMLDMGKLLKRDAERSASCYEIAAEAGIVVAQWELGECYAEGKGVSANAELAVKWLSAAAKTPTRQRILADRFLLGRGVPRDNIQGFYWMLRAAEAGDSEAQLEVAKAYAHGRGVATNLVLASAWFQTIEDVRKFGQTLDGDGNPISKIPEASPEQVAAGEVLAANWRNGKTTPLSLTTP